MRGPKPIPTKLKVLRGNPGQHKLNKNEPKPPPGAPPRPDYLNAAEQKIWNRLTKDACEAGLLTSLDGGVLEVHVTALANMAKLKPEIEKGFILKGKKGGYYQNPYVAVYNKEREFAMKSGGELGYTPSSRSRVTVTKPKQEEDPFVKYEGGRK